MGRNQSIHRLRKGFVGDFLTWWAWKLGKSRRTIRRYAQGGVIPGAYQTPGGHWRAPFTPSALQAVEEKLRGFARHGHGPYFRLLASVMPPDKLPEADLCTCAFALLLALQRQRMVTELRLQRFRLRILALLGNPQRAARLKRAEAKSPLWKQCLEKARKLGLRKAALLAAYALAVVEAYADSETEAVAASVQGQFTPFGHQASGAVPLTEKPMPGSKADPPEHWQPSQIVRPTRNLLKRQSVIQKWQWILGRREARNAKPEFGLGYPGHPDAYYIHTPMRYLSRQTFYGWYSRRVRNDLLKEAWRWLNSAQADQAQDDQPQGSDAEYIAGLFSDQRWEPPSPDSEVTS